MGPRAAIFGCAGVALSDDEAAFFREADPWGFIVFRRNVDTPEQLARLTIELREAVGRDAPILVDQEGGRVQRLGPPHWSQWENVAEMVARVPDALIEQMLELRYRLIADELRAVGLDVNCAPSLDLRFAETHAAIGPRAFSSDPAVVARLGAAVIRGLKAGGVRPVVKHIPGHGRAGVDSHRATPTVDLDRETLSATDFAPFRALADCGLGMTAHIRYTAIDPDLPGTLSPAVIGAIREDIGFGGCLMTDDISMDALSPPMPERCEKALAAGCDLILHCNGDRAEMDAVAQATPRLSGASLARAAAGARPLRARPLSPEDAAAHMRALTESIAENGDGTGSGGHA